MRKKLLSTAKDVLEMNPLNAPFSSSRITSFVRSMLPHRRSVSNDTLLLMPTFPIRVLMDTLALYWVCLLSVSVKNYFNQGEMNDENAKYIVSFATFFDPSREFIQIIFKRYQLLTAFSLGDNVKGQKPISDALEKDEKVPNANQQIWMMSLRGVPGLPL